MNTPAFKPTDTFRKEAAESRREFDDAPPERVRTNVGDLRETLEPRKASPTVQALLKPETPTETVISKQESMFFSEEAMLSTLGGSSLTEARNREPLRLNEQVATRFGSGGSRNSLKDECDRRDLEQGRPSFLKNPANQRQTGMLNS
jgi:hypothetical protein